MNEKLNMQDLVNVLAKEHGFNKKGADTFVREFFLLIEQTLEKDNYVKIKGLGTFKLIEVGSRESVNVNSKERFKIEGHTKVSFTPDTTLRDLVNKPFAHFETVVLNENTVLENTAEEDNDDEVEQQEGIGAVLDEGSVTDSDSLEIQIVEEKPSVLSEILEELPVEINQDDNEKVDKEVQPEIPALIEEDRGLLLEEIIARELQVTEKELPQITSTNNESKRTGHKKEDKPIVSYLVAIVALVLLFCGGALVYVYYPDFFSSDKELNSESVDMATVSAISVDTIKAYVKADTVGEVASLKKKEVVASSKEQVKTESGVTNIATASKVSGPINPDSVDYTIVGTKTLYTVKEGETLTRVSLRFYGTKKLWPYIVKHNRDVIKNPDNVPYGTTLKIPELTLK